MPLVPTKAVNFVAKWEGFSPKATNALDGVWTIGYGHTEGVHPGDTITEEQALAKLRADLRDAARHVAACVKRPLSPNEAAALISFTYNVGPAGFAESTLCRRVNRRFWLSEKQRAKKIREAFLMWTKAPNGPGGALVTMPGLVRRRKAEARLFNS